MNNSSPQRHRENMEINQITDKIIGAAIELHKTLVPYE